MGHVFRYALGRDATAMINGDNSDNISSTFHRQILSSFASHIERHHNGPDTNLQRYEQQHSAFWESVISQSTSVWQLEVARL